MLSDDVRLIARPFSVYEELGAADEPAPGRSALEKAALLLLVIGAFVSLTTAGRLVAFHVASVFVFYAFLPLVQAGAVAISLRAVAPAADVRRALALHFTGYGAWKLLLLALALVPFVTRDTYASFVWLLRTGALPAALLGTIGWTTLTTYACFRAGLGLSRRRASAVTLVYYLLSVGMIVGYYLATNQIQPQFPGIP